METKMFEVRDDGTLIPVLVVKYEVHDKKDLRFFERGGVDIRSIVSIPPVIQVTMLTTMETERSAGAWKGRTMRVAHRFIQEKWYELENYAVIDVEFILGETQTSKSSELY